MVSPPPPQIAILSCILQFKIHTNRNERQYQRPPSRNLQRNNILSPLPHQRRHPAEPRLPQTHHRPHPTVLLPLAQRQSRRGRRQRSDLAARHRRYPTRLPRLRRLPGRLQQSDLRLWGQCRRRPGGARVWVLRDDCRGQRRGPGLGRHERRAHAHDQHAHYGRGGV